MAPPKKTAPALDTEKSSESVMRFESKEFPGLVVNAPDPLQPAPAKASVDPRVLDRQHRIAMEANFPHLNRPDRFHQKESNLPKVTSQSLALDAQNAAHAIEVAAKHEAKHAEDKRKWIKLGLQPTSQGFILHVENYEGDTKVKETVWKKLSPLAARERLALHMSALWAGF